jgi:hypothetical protein
MYKFPEMRTGMCRVSPGSHWWGLGSGRAGCSGSRHCRLYSFVEENMKLWSDLCICICINRLKKVSR